MKSLAVLLTAISCSALAQDAAYTPPTAEERWQTYLRTNFTSPGVVFRALGPAVGDHIDKDPPEWGVGFDAYARRAAYRLGRFAVRGSIEHGGAALLQHESRYIPCKCSGALPRLKYALLSNFLTYDSHGRRTLHVARITGAYAGEALAARMWLPDGTDIRRETIRGGNQQMMFGGVFHLVREFWPEIRRTVLRRK